MLKQGNLWVENNTNPNPTTKLPQSFFCLPGSFSLFLSRCMSENCNCLHMDNTSTLAIDKAVHLHNRRGLKLTPKSYDYN